MEIFNQDDIIPLVLKQNGLEGKHSVPRFKARLRGVTTVTMGIAPELVNGLRALGGFAGMGAMTVRVNIKKEKETVEENQEASKPTEAPAKDLVTNTEEANNENQDD